ncbi:stress-response A/B barrel domain-containing protein UP3-like [Humulus lupulus]|uniref:stress-response A/B barrel domain-containing protein UP3-like n=1 Tax=Humulus lupulus TaxID=3486 RepID=UPI002B4081C7|nr:stress-response A/B barrel domain-containing protein UP3-like [Humulus lupulus]
MTMCLRLRPNPALSLPFLAPKHLLKLNPKPSLSFIPHSRTSTSYFSSKITMSSSSTQTIEHIVLFKVKDDTDPSKVNAMVNGLSGLKSLDQVLHITAGPLLRNRSSTLNFTHMLHSRYSSKEDLNAYSQHPNHISVVKESVLPICEDIMAVDWVAEDLQGPVSPSPGSALRVTFLKLKENLGEEKKSEILGVIKGIKNSFGQIAQLTCGENFSPGRAKGYSIASIAVFPGPSELEAVDSNEELVRLQKEKVKEHLESVVVVDYLVSSPQSASL